MFLFMYPLGFMYLLGFPLLLLAFLDEPIVADHLADDLFGLGLRLLAEPGHGDLLLWENQASLRMFPVPRMTNCARLMRLPDPCQAVPIKHHAVPASSPAPVHWTQPIQKFFEFDRNPAPRNRVIPLVPNRAGFQFTWPLSYCLIWLFYEASMSDPAALIWIRRGILVGRTS